MGLIQAQLGKFDTAANAFLKAHELAPNNPDISNNLASIYMTLGRVDDAAAMYRKTIQADKTYGPAWLGLCDAQKAQLDDADMDTLVKLGEKPDLPPAHKAPIMFALARVRAKHGEHEQAFACLTAANAAGKQARPPGAQNHMSVAHEIQNGFNADTFSQKIAPLDAGKGLIFVVGMPRSGTSLVELILSAHPDVTTVGESDIALQAIQALEQKHKAGFSIICPNHPGKTAEWGATIEKRLRERAGNAGVIVDKTPLNHLFVGLIHMALPGARIVHTQRDLRDTCLSCYEQYFTAGQPWSFDLKDIAAYAKAYHHLMAHWRKTIPDAFLDFSYEALASTPHENVRALLEHCGLDWHEDCLSPHKSSAATHTASAAQVREPIHPRSIGRWKNYQTQLEPLLAELADILDGPASA